MLPRAGISITFVLSHETHSFRRTLTPRLFLHSPHSIPIIDKQVFGLPKGMLFTYLFFHIHTVYPDQNLHIHLHMN